MGIKIYSRVKQFFMYIFLKYNSSYDEEVKNILSLKEFEIFSKMTNYDKLHSYRLFKLVQKDNVLKNILIYQKLALLHDCGKGNVGLFRRIKKVLIGDKILDRHSQNAYSLLKDINIELAELCLLHHKKNVEEKMKIFQKLDDL